MGKRWLVLLAILCAICLIAATYDRHVLLINKSSRSIVEFYASNEDSNSWEENILRDGYVSPGYQIQVNVDDGTGHCVYDFKAVLRGGATAIGRSINVCKISSWTVTD